jgi:hypothetical protein
MTASDLRDRICSVCASQPLGLIEAVTPFSFDLQPTGVIDGVFRVEIASGDVIGGFNYREEYTDRVTVWVARKYAGDSHAAYRQLRNTASSIRAAVIRDGAEISGEYIVVDGDSEARIAREDGREFAVLQVALPVNYEATV